MQKRQLLVTIVALILGVLTYIGSAIGIQSPTVLAHSFVIGSGPVDGSTVSTVPAAIHIYFNTPISPISTAQILAVQDGKLVDVTGSPSRVSPSNPRQLDTPIKTPDSTSQGSYEVRWVAVSTTDGHTTNGLIGFNVGFSSTGLSGTPTPGPITSNNLDGTGGIRVFDFINILSVAWDWLVLMALTFWIGFLIAERLIFARMDRTLALLESTRKQSLSLQGLCLAVLLIGEVVTLILRSVRLDKTLDGNVHLDTLLQLITQTNYGTLWAIRILIIVIALGLLRWTNRSIPTLPMTIQGQRALTRSDALRARTTQELPTGTPKTPTKEQLERAQAAPMLSLSQHYTPLWLLLAGALLLTRVLSGDAAQILQPRISAVTFDWLYALAQGIWFGGCAYLGYILLPLLSALDRDRHADTLLAIQRRFTPFYIASIGILLVSGLFLSEASISNIQQFLSDSYGRTLLVKIALTLIVFALALYTLFGPGRKLTRQALLLPVVGADLPVRRVRQTSLENTGRNLKLMVSVQSWLGAGILLCMALLSFYAPPIVFPNIDYTTTTATQTTPQAKTQTKQAGDLSVSLQVDPAKVGSPNIVILQINDSGGKSVSNATVQLTTNMDIMDMGTAYATINGGNPTYKATFTEAQAFSMGGNWDIDVSIQRPGQATVQTRFKVLLT